MARHYNLSRQYAQEKIDEYQKKIDYWKMAKQVMEDVETFSVSQIPSGFTDEIPNFFTYVFTLYLKIGSVTEVAKELNNLGVCKKGGKPEGNKLNSNDISSIIRSETIPNKNLLTVARNEFEFKANKVNKKYG